VSVPKDSAMDCCLGKQSLRVVPEEEHGRPCRHSVRREGEFLENVLYGFMVPNTPASEFIRPPDVLPDRRPVQIGEGGTECRLEVPARTSRPEMEIRDLPDGHDHVGPVDPPVVPAADSDRPDRVLLYLDSDDRLPVDLGPVQVRDDPGFAVLADAVCPVPHGPVRDGASDGPSPVGDSMSTVPPRVFANAPMVSIASLPKLSFYSTVVVAPPAISRPTSSASGMPLISFCMLMTKYVRHPEINWRARFLLDGSLPRGANGVRTGVRLRPEEKKGSVRDTEDDPPWSGAEPGDDHVLGAGVAAARRPFVRARGRRSRVLSRSGTVAGHAAIGVDRLPFSLSLSLSYWWVP